VVRVKVAITPPISNKLASSCSSSGRLCVDGWLEAVTPRGIIEDEERKIKEVPDLTLRDARTVGLRQR
jgi:hypothetical protein